MPNYLPTKGTHPFFHVCLTHLLHVLIYDLDVPCHVVSSRLTPCLLTSGKNGIFNKAYCCCQQEPALETKFHIQSAALQMQFSALPIPQRKRRKNQKGRHVPSLFLCCAIQGNQFSIGLPILSAVYSTRGFSAAKLFRKLWDKACQQAGHGN